MYRNRNRGRKRTNSQTGNDKQRSRSKGRSKSPHGNKRGKSPHGGRGKGHGGQGKSPHGGKGKSPGRGRGNSPGGGRGRGSPSGRGFVMKAPRGTREFADQFQWMGGGHKEQYLAQEARDQSRRDRVFDPSFALQEVLESDSEEVYDSEEDEVEAGEGVENQGWLEDKAGDDRLRQGSRSDKRYRRKFSPLVFLKAEETGEKEEEIDEEEEDEGSEEEISFDSLEEEDEEEEESEDEGRPSLLDFLDDDDLMNDDSPALDDEAIRDYVANTEDSDMIADLVRRMSTEVDVNPDVLDDDTPDEDEEDENDEIVISDEEQQIRYDYMVGPWKGTRKEDEEEANKMDYEKKFQRVLNAEFLPVEGTMLGATAKPRSFQERLRIPRGRRHQRSPPRDLGKKKKGKKGKEKEGSDDEFGRGRGKRGRKKNRNKEDAAATIRWVNQAMHDFFHGDEDYHALPPMSKKSRAMAHQVAGLYKFESKSFGSGKSRHTILYRTINSAPPDPHELNMLLKKFESVPGSAFDGNNKRSKGKSGKQQQSAAGGQTKRELDGKVVGASASPISEENVGNRLLRTMGWSGGGLGAGGQGIQDPISMVIKNNRHGLGFGK